jgi:hypothetical protein
VFEGSIAVDGGKLYPEITGYAYVNAESDLILDERDPFCYGIRSDAALCGAAPILAAAGFQPALLAAKDVPSRDHKVFP